MMNEIYIVFESAPIWLIQTANGYSGDKKLKLDDSSSRRRRRSTGSSNRKSTKRRRLLAEIRTSCDKATRLLAEIDLESDLESIID